MGIGAPLIIRGVERRRPRIPSATSIPTSVATPAEATLVPSHVSAAASPGTPATVIPGTRATAAPVAHMTRMAHMTSTRDTASRCFATGSGSACS